jgi:hypothetical protein
LPTFLSTILVPLSSILYFGVRFFWLRRVRFVCNTLLLEEGVVLLLHQIGSVEAVELCPFSGLLDAA